MAPPSKSDAEKAVGTSLFLVFGTDEFEVSRRAKHLVDQHCPEADRAFGLEVIDAACDTVEESLQALRRCVDGLQTVGFFGSAKFIWLRDASFLYDSRPGKSAAVKTAIAGLTEEIKRGLMPGVRLLVSAGQVDKRTAFYKTMDKLGQVQIYDLPDKSYKWDAHAANVLRGLFEDVGLRARPGVIELIVNRAGPYTRQLSQEVEKLSLYLRDRKEVTEQDVLDIVSPAREHAYGELADLFAKQDLVGALRVIPRLLEQKESSSVGLMMGLQLRVHDLLVYRVALARRWVVLSGSDEWPKVEWSNSPEAEAFFTAQANDPRRANPYWAGILAKQARGFTLERLQHVQRTLVELHGSMTDGSAPADFLLEWFMIKTLGQAA